MSEVVALEQEGSAEVFGDRVGEAVAEVEAGRMAASPAEPEERLCGKRSDFGVDRREADLVPDKKRSISGLAGGNKESATTLSTKHDAGKLTARASAIA